MNWLWWLQIAADVLLIGGLLVLLSRLRKGAASGISAPKEMEAFLEEGQRLSQEFDRLLGEKRELVNTTISTLDNRIAQLRAMVEEMESHLKSAGKASRKLNSSQVGSRTPRFEAKVDGGANDDGQAVAKAHHDLSELPSRMTFEPQFPKTKCNGKKRLQSAAAKLN